MIDVDIELVRFGNQLKLAAELDLAGKPRALRLPRRRMLVLLAAGFLVLAGVGAGIAATMLKTPAQEEQGLLNGAATFAGTHPICTQQETGHFRCVLASTPTELTFADGGSYLGVKMESLDSSKHVDGGCVSISAAGRVWDCYLGKEAVRRGIIGSAYLGQFVSEPPHA